MTLERGEDSGKRECRTESLLGARVHNLDSEEVGRVEEIMIDLTLGKVSYAVVSFGALAGMGDRLFAVPWRLLRLDPVDKKCVLALRRESLKTAPGFSRDDWPRMADREWALQIHDFYGERPYWEEAPEERRGSSPGRRAADRH